MIHNSARGEGELAALQPLAACERDAGCRYLGVLRHIRFVKCFANAMSAMMSSVSLRM